jgi:hypothetical protein
VIAALIVYFGIREPARTKSGGGGSEAAAPRKLVSHGAK